MHPFAFLGGALVGAGGLLGLALLDSKKNDQGKLPENCADMSPDEVERQLNRYFFRAQEIYAECNQIALEGGELIFTPVELPDDSPLQKAANWLGGRANRVARSMRIQELKMLQEKARKLYAQYRPAFIRANAIAVERGLNKVDLADLAAPVQSIKANNALDNDDWGFELEAGADLVRNYIELSCARAEELIELLNRPAVMQLAVPRAIEK